MTIAPVFIGIDVAKAHLDVFDPRAARPRRIANQAEAITTLLAGLAGCTVVIEATGAYDASLRQLLHAAGIAVVRVNPARARDFARAAGFLAKTDRIDARMLSLMGERLRPEPEAAPSPERQRLSRLNKRRDQLVAMRAQERTRRRECDDPEAAAMIDGHIQWLSCEIAALQRAIAALIKASTALRAQSRLLRSIPGIGAVAAVTVMALMPELGRRSPGAIAALAGLAPFNADSGTLRGKRIIKGGRKRVRNALYMAALAASRSDTRLGDFYRSLINTGKAPKLALVALARKLAVILNAVIRDAIPFQT